MAELASRQPRGVVAPVKPMAAERSSSRAASRAVGAFAMIDSDVVGPDM